MFINLENKIVIPLHGYEITTEEPSSGRFVVWAYKGREHRVPLCIGTEEECEELISEIAHAIFDGIPMFWIDKVSLIEDPE